MINFDVGIHKGEKIEDDEQKVIEKMLKSSPIYKDDNIWSWLISKGGITVWFIMEDIHIYVNSAFVYVATMSLSEMHTSVKFSNLAKFLKFCPIWRSIDIPSLHKLYTFNFSSTLFNII